MTDTLQLTLVGRLTQASNATFLARNEPDESLWVYKPVAGEAPLWDFPEGTLSRREVACYELSRRWGLDVVPETRWVEGPLGPGSAQAWIEGEPTGTVEVLPPTEVDESWLPVVMGEDGEGRDVVLAHRADEQLRTICLFDLLINNSDRKGGHLIEAGGRIHGVDHGVSLHTQDKIRTILWGFAGQELTSAERELVGQAVRLEDTPPEGLTADEWDAVAGRAQRLLEVGYFPEPSGRWPAIPWPPL